MAETSNQNNNPIDLREVVKIFNDRFDKADQNYRELAKSSNDRFDQMDQNYRELVEFLAGEFDKIHQTKADKVDMEENFNLVLNRVATINTKIDDYRADQIGLKRQVDKHEKWHFAVADKVGVKLLSK
ncbi:MAG: hypothetical protein L7H18_02395 [Candidatus Nealsonbacteria bacterium DGGOD1a]|jgi:hypothetical protein|nr:MAG: hypothetical protein L7H18_02395 [Candidatus Nealsonbacteria bacterium DGGOD1a]